MQKNTWIINKIWRRFKRYKHGFEEENFGKCVKFRKYTVVLKGLET